MPAHPTLVEALHSREFEAILPELVAYAARRLRRIGWGEGHDHRPSGAEAEELVAEAVEVALSGKRVWPNDLDLKTFLEGVMWSQVEHRYAKEKRRRSYAHRVRDGAIGGEERAASNEQRHRQRELCAAVERALADDLELCALFGAFAAGAEKPADVAVALGWPVDRVKLAQRRMNRRLAAAGLALDPDDVGPEPLAGGRWIRPEGHST
jgi:DNA-directed RNA polymerase specialized sigma24 family protein